MTARRRTTVAALVLVNLLSGCVAWRTLPQAGAASVARQSRPFRIVGAHGAVDAVTRRRISQRLNGLGDENALVRQLAVMQELGGTPLITGNRATLLVDGPRTYGSMFAAMSHAANHINIEMYIFDEAVNEGRALTDVLVERARAGVAINVLYDALGSNGTPAALFEKLRAAGVQTCAFNPLNPLSSGKLDFTQRDHRKLVLVDGAIAFTGGINFSNTYSSSSRARVSVDLDSRKKGWRDTHIKVEGPVTLRMQKLFFQNWGKQDCPAVANANYLPAAKIAGDTLLRLDVASRDLPGNNTYLSALTAVLFAKESVDLTMAYFAPNSQLEQALVQAARRGVQVRLLLAGVSDFDGILQAGRAHYSRLLRSGIKIYEAREAVLHAKTLQVDGVWSTVGSTNWDALSFSSNDELNVVVIDRDFAAQMHALFEQDLQTATSIERESWSRRPLADRVKQHFWSLWEHWL